MLSERLIKLFLKIQFIALTIVLYTIATALILLTENTFEYFDIYFVNPLALNQVKANMGGLLIFAGTIPIMWLKTKKDYWLQTFMYILFFVIFARTISFFTDGFHSVTGFLWFGEGIHIYFCHYILKNFPDGSFFD